MDITYSSTTKSVNARSLLLPYTLGLILAMIIVQFVIMLTGERVTVLAGVLTAVVAVGILAWLWRHHGRLNHVRFGWTMAHAIAFATVTTSFNLHLLIHLVRVAAGTDGFDTAAHAFLATPWFGATLIMTSLWGVGLLVHVVGSVLGRGWEA